MQPTWHRKLQPRNCQLTPASKAVWLGYILMTARRNTHIIRGKRKRRKVRILEKTEEKNRKISKAQKSAKFTACDGSRNRLTETSGGRHGPQYVRACSGASAAQSRQVSVEYFVKIFHDILHPLRSCLKGLWSVVQLLLQPSLQLCFFLLLFLCTFSRIKQTIKG